MNLKELHQTFLKEALMSHPLRRDVITPVKKDAPLIPSNRWVKSDSSLSKTYHFMRPGDRDRFLFSIIANETSTGHAAEVTFTSSAVKIVLKFESSPSELDSEYANYADVTYKDVVYSAQHEDRLDDERLSERRGRRRRAY